VCALLFVSVYVYRFLSYPVNYYKDMGLCFIVLSFARLDSILRTAILVNLFSAMVERR